MLMTPHALLGLVVVFKIPNAALFLPLALFSHYLLDITPHWNWRPDKRFFSLLGIAVDFALAVGVIFFFAREAVQPLITVLGGALPAFVDIFDAPYYFFGWGGFWEKYTRFSQSYQSRTSPFWGILNQILVILICFLILISPGR